MGVCNSQEVRQQAFKNRKIEQQIARERIRESDNQKLLLLGAGECGKSTVLKQMQILHKSGFSEAEVEDKRLAIYSNIVVGMTTMLRAMDPLGLRLSNSTREPYAKVVLKVMENDHSDYMGTLTEELYEALKSLWDDVGVQQCYDRRSDYQLADCTKYFLDALDRIHANNYRPTDQDILHCRVATTGVIEVEFVIKTSTFRIFDVGGQRSERRKWIHLFDNVNGIIFICAVSEYDQKLREDERTNRMTESLELFKTVCNSPWFDKASVVVFLNKKDLFEEKLSRVPLTVFFKEFSGGNPQSYKDCIEWIAKKFELLNQLEERKIYVHETCATDTEQTQKVIESVVDTVINKNLKGTGMD